MIPDAEPIGATIVRVMLEIVNAQTDHAEREAMLAIMRKDGLIPAEPVDA